MTCSICQQSGHNKRTCPNQQKATTGKYAGMTAAQIEAIFAERERKNYEELVAPIVAAASADEEEEEGKCDCCDAILGEDEHIFIFTRGDEDRTMCQMCGDELHEEMKANRWRRDDDEEECECPDCGNTFSPDSSFSLACCDKCWVGDDKKEQEEEEEDWECQKCHATFPIEDDHKVKQHKHRGTLCLRCYEYITRDDESEEDELCAAIDASGNALF